MSAAFPNKWVLPTPLSGWHPFECQCGLRPLHFFRLSFVVRESLCTTRAPCGRGPSLLAVCEKGGKSGSARCIEPR